MGQLWCSKYGGNICLGWVGGLFYESDEYNLDHETQIVRIRYNDNFFLKRAKIISKTDMQYIVCIQ